MFLPHDLIKIRPRGVYTLTVYVLVLVKHIIKNLDSQMGHSDIVYIRETHTESDCLRGEDFCDGVYFASDIAGGLLHA